MNVELTEKILTAVNTGRTADVVLGHMRGVFEIQRLRVLAKLKGNYRAGEFNQVMTQCLLAELCVLDDLENQLTSQTRRGESALNQVQGDEP